MKKILLAFDGTNFSEGAFEFARKLNELSPILLTGVFLPQSMLANLWSYAPSESGANAIPLLEPDESAEVHQNITRFEKLCQSNSIEYRVHKDFFDLALPELKHESQYADLLILGSQVFYGDKGANEANDYLRFALQDIKCPVILVPEKYTFPESIILAFDGSDNSTFAIKQFAYLFPELTNRKTVLVYANENPDKDFPDQVQIEELSARHYPDLTFYKMDTDPKKYFRTWIDQKRSAILVSGSYGKKGLPGLFRRSFVKRVIADHLVPVFIAHR